MKSQKATHEQLKRHNRQLLLRAVYHGLADNRAALAQLTGLARPTVSSLVSEIIVEGLLSERGRGPAKEGGGKRPRLLEFVPDAKQVIGVAVEQDCVLGVLSNLAGKISAHHWTELGAAEDALVLVREVINGLMAQLDAPLLCLGVGVPGTVDGHSGTVRRSDWLGWHQLPLASLLSERYAVPAYVGNRTELCALAQFAFGRNGETRPRQLVTVLVNHGVEVGVTLEGGSYHYGSDISSLRLSGAAGAGSERLDALLSWEATQRRIMELRQGYPESLLPVGGLSYMHLRYSAARGDAAALELYGELAAKFAKVIAWVVSLLQPDHLSLAGPIVDLGDGFLDRLVQETAAELSPGRLDSVTFSLASDNLGATGAVALALQRELAIL